MHTGYEPRLAVPGDLARYGAAFVAYVGLALATLSLRDNVLLLNWIIGPLFPLVALHVLPTVITSSRRLVRRAAR